MPLHPCDLTTLEANISERNYFGNWGFNAGIDGDKCSILLVHNGPKKIPENEMSSRDSLMSPSYPCIFNLMSFCWPTFVAELQPLIVLEQPPLLRQLSLLLYYYSLSNWFLLDTGLNSFHVFLLLSAQQPHKVDTIIITFNRHLRKWAAEIHPLQTCSSLDSSTQLSNPKNVEVILALPPCLHPHSFN